MNCQTFSDSVSDIARDQMMDAAVRAQALAHAGECLNCSARLKAQQLLTADLRELVLATKDKTASPAVWENLAATFDARGVTQLNTNRRRWIYAAVAVAAILLLTFALAPAVKVRRSPANVQVLITASSTAMQTIQSPKGTEAEVRQDGVVAGGNRKPQITSHRRSLARQALTPQAYQPKEIATDFIPLTYGNPEVGAGAQMVRVELPRSAMASYGLPVNMDRADQRVKADVLLSADGLARAIRFIQ